MIGFGLIPLIYAVRYEVFRKYLKQKLCKSQGAQTADGVAGDTGPQH